MALLGAQLVITMVMASFLQKLAPHYSFARWLLCGRGLVRFLHPTSEELKSLSGHAPQNKGKNKGGREKKNGHTEDSDTFTIPRNLEVSLDSIKIQPIDVAQLHFYSDYQWLIDFAVAAAIVYTLSEVFYSIFKIKDEVNLSLMWCILVIGFSCKVLFSLTAIYFKGEESKGERSIVVTAGFFLLLVAMGVLVVDENFLEFGLEKAYINFHENAAAFLKQQGVQPVSPGSKMGFKFSLALLAGIIGVFFTFPGFRLAKMHVDSLKYCADSPFLKLVFHISFISPFLYVLMWVRPVSREYFTERKWPGMSSAIMSTELFETTRILMVILVVILRLILMPWYLQSYLNMAQERLDSLKKEAGRISGLELQKLVARVFYYLCVVALQYIAPLLVCLYLSLLFKTLGQHSWYPYGDEKCLAPEASAASSKAPNIVDEAVMAAGQEVLTGFKQLFTPIVYRGVLGFLTWWSCAAMFGTSAIGLIYHSYFIK